jgi:hypothetical protein
MLNRTPETEKKEKQNNFFSPHQHQQQPIQHMSDEEKPS